jgi:hypothetical protein
MLKELRRIHSSRSTICRVISAFNMIPSLRSNELYNGRNMITDVSFVPNQPVEDNSAVYPSVNRAEGYEKISSTQFQSRNSQLLDWCNLCLR